MTCGVYKLIFPNGKIYVGSSLNMENRLREHKRMLNKGVHHSKKLQYAFNKHGMPEFYFVLICRPEDRLMYEQNCMDIWKPDCNMSMIAGSIEHTPETRKAIGEANSRRPPLTAEQSAQRSASRKGIPIGVGHACSEKTKEKLRVKAIARPASESMREKNRQRMFGNTYRRGTTQSEETKTKIGLGCKGKNMGNQFGLGKTRTPEQRAIMSERAKAGWEKRRARIA
jgi:group I intron endonuclease